MCRLVWCMISPSPPLSNGQSIYRIDIMWPELERMLNKVKFLPHNDDSYYYDVFRK